MFPFINLLQWIDGSPTTFTLWNTRKTVSVSHTETCIINKFQNQMITTQTLNSTHFHDLNVNMSLQPQADKSKACTAMFISTFYDKPTWFTIPCNETIQTDDFFLICAKQVPQNERVSTPYNQANNFNYSFPIKLSSKGCLKDWFFIAGKCLSVLIFSNTELNETSGHMCQNIRGNVFNMMKDVDEMSLLFHYFDKLSHHSNKDITVTLHYMRQCVHWYSKPGILKHWSSYRKQTKCSDRFQPSHTLCEMVPHLSNNLTASSRDHLNYFRCASGTYILNTYVCDGEADCIQGEDENGVECDILCSETETGKTLPSTFCRELCETGSCTCNPATHFHCSKGGCIHYNLLCDLKNDCRNDTSDEEHCAHNVKDNNNQFVCNNNQIINATLVCDGIRHCFDESDEVQSLCTDTLYAFMCFETSQAIFSRYHDDMRPDCNGTDLSDELLYDGMITGSVAMDYACKYPEREIPCIPGHPRCFPLIKLCVYERDVTGQLLFCRNGEHLLSCDFFLCPSPLVKCHLSYCIPVSYICNGQKDCPEGDDENNCSNGEILCSGMLRCKHSTCVHMQNVCDGVVDCQETADDEKLCHYDKCQAGCNCVGPIYQCQFSMDIKIYDIPTSTVILHLTNQSLQIYNISFQYFDRLLVLNLSHNGIAELPSGSVGLFAKQKYLLHLSLMYNRLTVLRQNSFIGLKNLNTLSLEGNAISSILNFAFNGLASLTSLDLSVQNVRFIEEMAFAGLHSLTHINLSYNLLVTLPNYVFIPLHSLSLVDMRNNSFRQLTRSLFQVDVAVHIFLVDLADYCCGLNVRICYAPESSMTFCSGIFRTNFHRYRAVTEVVSSLVMNLALVYIYTNRHFTHSSSFLRLNRTVADIISVSYLAVLLVGDIYMMHFMQQFMTRSAWRTGAICKTGLFLSCSSVLMSYMILIFSAVDFMLQTKFPMKILTMKQQLPNIYKQLLFSAWFIVLSIATLVSYVSTSMPNDICLFYFVTYENIGLDEIFITLFFYLFVLLSQIATCIMDYQSYMAIRRASHRYKNTHEKKMSMRKLVISTSVQICLTAIKITAISFQNERTITFAIWTASWMCANALLNPLLYFFQQTYHSTLKATKA